MSTVENFEANEEVEDLDELNEVLPENFAITSYGADYPVDGLVNRISRGDIVIPVFTLEPEPGQSTVSFQREFVWQKPQADRFIESLLLGLPVPGIFLVKESNGKHLVLDGQQRLRTLENYYNGIFRGKEFLLENVQPQWKRKSYKNLHPDDRRRLDDSIIHATVVRQDEPSDDQSSIYLIFERLNSGGTLLQPQEIRVALYHGQFATLLGKLNENSSWRSLFGKKSPRLKDIELILRFFALYFHSSRYRRPMKDFLNRYMAANRFLAKNPAEQLVELFQETIKAILNSIGPRAFRPKAAVNAAVLDSVMFGVASRLARSPAPRLEGLRSAFESLMGNESYLTAISKSTADEENVRLRLDLAREAFGEL